MPFFGPANMLMRLHNEIIFSLVSKMKDAPDGEWQAYYHVLVGDVCSALADVCESKEELLERVDNIKKLMDKFVSMPESDKYFKAKTGNAEQEAKDIIERIMKNEGK